jgi:hypothetical protein
MRGANPERHIKMIVNLNGDRMMFGPHHTSGFWIDTNGNTGSSQNNYEPAMDVIQLNHYATKTREEFALKVNRGSSCWYKGRTWGEFDELNKNEVEDLTALNFYRGNQ